MLQKAETWVALIAGLISILSFAGDHWRVPSALTIELRYAGVFLAGLIVGLLTRGSGAGARARPSRGPLRRLAKAVLVVSTLSMGALVSLAIVSAGTARGEMAAVWAGRSTVAVVVSLILASCV